MASNNKAAPLTKAETLKKFALYSAAMCVVPLAMFAITQTFLLDRILQ
jgi:hypothetical protein